MCYRTREQRDRIAAHLDELIGARATVRFGPDDALSAPSVRRRLVGDGETTPVQVLDADRWPEGLNTLAYRLNPAREALPEDSDRGGCSSGGSDDHITAFALERRPVGLAHGRVRLQGRRVTEKNRKERGRGAAGG